MFLEVITGPMGCGKTEELIRRLRRAQIAKQKVVLFKPVVDVRSGEDLTASRNGLTFPAISLRTPSEIAKHDYLSAQVIGFEEAQFFGPTLVDVIASLVSSGKRVICSGLNTDFRGEPFGSMPHLLSLADDVTTLTAICMRCGSDRATRTQRLLKGHPAPYDSAIIQVGGDESYEARCRKCHEVPRSKHQWFYARVPSFMAGVLISTPPYERLQ